MVLKVLPDFTGTFFIKKIVSLLPKDLHLAAASTPSFITSAANQSQALTLHKHLKQ
jgi:hypothetical protein